MKLFHTTRLESAASIEVTGFVDNGYAGETPCTWWSTAMGGHLYDLAVFSVEIPDELAAQWLNEEGTVQGQYQNFCIPAEVVNHRFPWKREPDRDVPPG